MKLVAFCLLATSLFARIDSIKDIHNFSDEQMEVMNISYLVGQQKGLGIDLAAICIVENVCRLKDNNPNHIFGPHQIDVNEHNFNSQALQSNPYYSAKAALSIFMKYAKVYGFNKSTNTRYLIRKRSIDEVHMIYNAGYKPHRFNKQHLAKINKAKQILKEYYGIK